MCGFLVNSEELDIVPSGSLLARGPDEQGHVASNNLELRNFRLSIVGLDAGIQPSRLRNSVFLFNGEVYNFRKLATEFSLSEQASLSDTVCVHELINKIGIEKAIPNLVGHFAFFYLDTVSGNGYFIRDVMGVKPLFFYKRGSQIIVCSDLVTIVDNISQKIAAEAALEAILFGGHTGETTLYEDIFVTLPGVLYQFDTKTHKLSKNIIFNSEYYKRKEGNLYELLRDSIDEQSDIDVPGVCLVSSGIDSRIVKKIALPKKNLVAVTAISPDMDLLEEDINTDPDTIQLNVSARKSVFSFEYMLKSYGTVPAHNNFFALCMMYHKISGSKFFDTELPIKVALTGEGADEYFGGYGRYKKLAAYLNGEKVEWISELQSISGFWLYLMNARLHHTSIKWLMENGVDIDSIIKRHVRSIPNFIIENKPSLMHLSAYDIQTNLLYGLHKQDLAGMLSSVEVRVPFLKQDLHFIAADGKLAEASKELSKLKLRRVAKNLGIDQNKKIGFPVSLRQFIPENYTPSDRVCSLLPFAKTHDMPTDLFQGVYMMDLLLGFNKN